MPMLDSSIIQRIFSFQVVRRREISPSTYLFSKFCFVCFSGCLCCVHTYVIIGLIPYCHAFRESNCNLPELLKSFRCCSSEKVTSLSFQCGIRKIPVISITNCIQLSKEICGLNLALFSFGIVRNNLFRYAKFLPVREEIVQKFSSCHFLIPLHTTTQTNKQTVKATVPDCETILQKNS